jgi:hypothetical protein
LKEREQKSEPAEMQCAVEAVRKTAMGFLKASKIFEVPDRFSKTVSYKIKHAADLSEISLGRKRVITGSR